VFNPCFIRGPTLGATGGPFWGKKGRQSNTYPTRRIILRSPAELLMQAGTRVTDLSISVSSERCPEAFDEQSGEGGVVRGEGRGEGDGGRREECSVFSFQQGPIAEH
jgi:hypothetical protein